MLASSTVTYSRCRYDLLCIEGIARALRIYLGLDRATPYKLKMPPGGESELLTATVDAEVGTSHSITDD